MSLRATEHVFTGTTTPYTSYDSTKTTLGKWIIQNTGSNLKDKWAGPLPLTIWRGPDSIWANTGVTSIEVGNDHWIFLGDWGNPANTARRIGLCIFNTTTYTWQYKGFITLTYPTSQTFRSSKVVRYLHTTGTVSSSGTTITGSGTDWSTNRMAAGARIGFGTTDPTAVVDWYYISSIASDTSLTVSLAPSTISAGTSYVIEELRVYTSSFASGNAASSGLHVAKGINFDDFTIGGTTISTATTIDNIKAVYFLSSSSNFGTPCDILLSPSYTNTSHTCYGVNQTSSTKLNFITFNVRAALTVGSGTSASAYQNNCTCTPTLNGGTWARQCATLATASHGAGNGVSSIYFITSTTFYRVEESALSSASYTPNDSMTEIPTGGTASFAAMQAFNSVSYISNLDRFLISNTTTRDYFTKYYTDGSQIDHIVFASTSNQNLLNANPDAPVCAIKGSVVDIEVVNGLMYMARTINNNTYQQTYCLPIGIDWTYTGTDNYEKLVTPKLSTSNCTRFLNLSVNCQLYEGSEIFGMTTEPYKAYYRTSGIDDNTGSWNLLDDTKDLTSVTAANNIQFMFKFKILGMIGIFPKIYNLVVTYEDNNTDSHYQPSAYLSDITNKIFAWRFSKKFNTTVPTLYIKLYNAVTGDLLVSDSTSSPSGTWEKSINDGSSWSSYDTSDLSNETTYIRYTPNSLTDDIKVKVLLTR